MSGQELSVGDVVTLKSGSPQMTITDISDDKICTCVWFEGNESHAQYYPALALEIYVKPKIQVGGGAEVIK